MIAPFVADGYGFALVFQVCVALHRATVLQRPGHCGRTFSASGYQLADGTRAFALLSWPHGHVEVVGDAYDVATALVAQLSAETADRLLRDLTGECPTEPLLPVAADARES